MIPRSPSPSRPAGRAPRGSQGRLALLLGGVIVGGLAPAALGAQTMSEPVVPRGRVRLDFASSVSYWDSRYGIGGDGKGAVEPLAADLTDERGVSLFPGIVTLEETLRSLTGDVSFQARAGSTAGRLTREATRLDFGLRIGVFDWLTLGASAPWLRGRSTLEFAFRADSAANVGLNPGAAGAGVSTLLSQLGEAAAAAEGRARAACAGGTTPACASAMSLAERASRFWTGMVGAYSASPLFPLSRAPVAARLQQAFSALNGELAAAGLPRVSAPLVFASAALDEAAYRSLPTLASAGVGMAPLQSDAGAWELGDVELNATVRLLDGEVLDSGAVSPRFAWALYGGFTVRLGTGVLDDPDAAFDFPSGDGQRDLEGRVDASVRVGARLELRGQVRRGTQAAVDIVRRVAPHEALFPQESSKRAVRWTPGAYTHVELSPRLRLGEAVALAADYRRFHKAEDAYALLGEEVPGLPEADVALLARETEVELGELALGVRYSSLGLLRRGRVGSPVEAGLRWVVPLSGGGGRTPKASRAEFSLSLFRRIWG